MSSETKQPLALPRMGDDVKSINELGPIVALYKAGPPKKQALCRVFGDSHRLGLFCFSCDVGHFEAVTYKQTGRVGKVTISVPCSEYCTGKKPPQKLGLLQPLWLQWRRSDDARKKTLARMERRTIMSEKG